eukprot:s4552_g4.t1
MPMLYGMYGLELMDVKEMNTASGSSSLSPSQGLIDCGATASAGPLMAVQWLISSVLKHDHQAVIDIQKSERPYFRFGNGQWGRALFRASITSHASGSPKTFKLFALPNPPQLHDPNSDRSSMVPILVGMDYLGDAHSGLCIDFITGMAIQTNDGEAFQLPVNHKGHYVLDIVQLLTDGHECHEGHAAVRVKGVEAVHSLQSLEFQPVGMDLRDPRAKASQWPMGAAGQDQMRESFNGGADASSDLCGSPTMCEDAMSEGPSPADMEALLSEEEMNKLKQVLQECKGQAQSSMAAPYPNPNNEESEMN